MLITNPNATFIVFNYIDRLGMRNLSIDKDEVTQITCKTSIMSIRTSKSKSSSSGTFEVQLAPDRNWISSITPGSWCVVLMSATTLSTEIPEKTPINKIYQNPNENSPKPNLNPSTVEANEQELKMVGRIDSVRVSSVVDNNGAIRTAYIVTGVDWGCVFDTNLYIDPQAELARAADPSYSKNTLLLRALTGLTTQTKSAKKTSSTSKKNSTQESIGVLASGDDTAQDGQAVEILDSSNNPYVLSELTSSRNILNILSIWGSTGELFQGVDDDTKSGMLGRAANEFRIPEALARYLGFVDDANQAVVFIKDLIKFRGGVLIEEDKYTDIDHNHDVSRNDGYAIVDYSKFFGINNMWQILVAHSNTAVNEVLCDIRFEKQNGKNLPLFTIYKRVKPFVINEEDIIFESGAIADKEKEEASKEYTRRLISRYKFLRKVEIPLEDIISVNAGTNWRDRMNFVDVTLDRPVFTNFYLTNYKPMFQIFDKKSVRRDGILRVNMTTDYVPLNSNGKDYDMNSFGGYRYLGREWYFDTHKMLNGAISMVGQNRYIQVGDNILIPIKALGTNYNMSYTLNVNKNNENALYLMAHVESISHSFSVDQNGARTFLTDIQFVRGIVCDKQGNAVKMPGENPETAVSLDMTLDQDSNKLNDKFNHATAIKTSYENNSKSGTFGKERS